MRLARPLAPSTLLVLLAVHAMAATGGPDGLGYTWADSQDGCPADPPTFTVGAVNFLSPTNAIGPEPLGFAMPWAGRVVTDVWISPTGFVAFSDQGGAGAALAPTLLPDPAPPNDLVAVYWRPQLARRVTTESFGDRFVIEWFWDGFGVPFRTESAWLTLHSDGRLRHGWGVSPWNVSSYTVGTEDAAGGLGATHASTLGPGEPGFPDPTTVASGCFTPPPLLDCSSPVVVGCGDVVDVNLPGAAPQQATLYGCTPGSYPGNERVLQLDVTPPRAVTVTVDLPDADLFHVPAPPDCSEANCLAWADSALELAVLFGGSRHVVVDTTNTGAAMARVTVTCADLPDVTCGGMLSGSTLSRPARQDSYSCAPVALVGPEAHATITTTSAGHLAVTLSAAPASLWVIVRDDVGTCLAAGAGGATVFDAPAGTYAITVDGETAASGDFTLEVDCGTRLDCGLATMVGCGLSVVGDTSTSPAGRVSAYGCSSVVTTGAEGVHLFTNPREQVVSARFITSQPGQRAFVLGSCDEGDCLFGELEGNCALLPAGDYVIVVDGPPGSEGPYELDLACGRIDSGGVDLRVRSLDTAAMPTDCRDVTVAGALRVELENAGDIDALPPFDVAAFLDVNGTGDYEPAADLLLGMQTVAAPLGPGQTDFVDVPVAGVLPFRDAIVHAKADPGRLTADVDRGNDLLSTAASCTVPAPPPAPLAVRLEWEWTASPVEPTFAQVESIPLVGDLDGDGRPEVLFGTQECCCGGPDTGVIWRAVSGRDGSELWSADAPALRMRTTSAPVLVDLDADGSPELVGQLHQDSTRLVALDATGGLRWASAPLALQGPFDTNGGQAAAADIDGDGRAEVIWGPNVLDANGAEFWTPDPGGTLGAADFGPISTAADLDDDGLQEVIAGPTAYRYDAVSGRGVILWTNPNVPDGYAAVGHVTGDPGPEVIVAEHGRLHCLDGRTGALLYTVSLPQGGGAPCGGFSSFRGGPPSIFDADGDGRAEIGVMTADWYAVYEGDGTLLWRAPAVECSSGTTSGTAFDLNGDGVMEVMIKDQEALRFLRGTDGTELMSIPGTSGTAREMPVVADVDADGQAEVVSVENRLLCGAGGGVGLEGVRVFGSDGAPWVGARGTWNQHAYHVSNVRSDLSVPSPTGIPCAPPSPLAEGTFRVQRPLQREPLGPDLTVTLLEVERTAEVDCRQDLRIRVRVGNGGGAAPGAAFPVAFVDEGNGGVLLTTVLVSDLMPGAFEDVEVTVSVSVGPGLEVRVTADDDGTGLASVVQCRVDNDECRVVESDVVGLPPTAPPADVGPALRATGHGSPFAADITGDFNWLLDFGAPRTLGTGPGEEHFHVYRGLLGFGAPTLTIVPGTEPWLSLMYQDTTPRALPSELPKVHGHKIFAGDACERESLN